MDELRVYLKSKGFKDKEIENEISTCREPRERPLHENRSSLPLLYDFVTFPKTTYKKVIENNEAYTNEQMIEEYIGAVENKLGVNIAFVRFPLMMQKTTHV